MRRSRTPRAFLVTLVAVVATVTGCAATPQTDLAASDVGVQLFQLPWTAVAEECETNLGPAGYGWVLLSPAQEHITGEQWWTSYQPVSYLIESRLGTRAEFADMTARCAAAGVDVIADAVINHMTGQTSPGVGWAGSTYAHTEYPGVYEASDFHVCGLTADNDIRDYTSREQVQTCELVNLADLDTSTARVQSRIIGYLNDLIDLGVAGIRIDAAKHIAAADLEPIVAALPEGTRVISEVIRSAREPIQPEEYVGLGEVFEFQYARDLAPQLASGLLADPRLDGARPMHVASDRAVVFIDNHDTERGEADVTARDGDIYVMANALMLADDYGTPIVYSGYAFSDRDAGAQTDADGQVTGSTCQAGASAAVADLTDGERTCVHAWPALTGMVEWRRVAGDAARSPGVHGDGNTYGFERAGRAVIAVNPGDEAAAIDIATGLPDGSYCNVVASGPRIGSADACTAPVSVADGTAHFVLPSGATSAIHLLSIVT